jgi:hypothetical protein
MRLLFSSLLALFLALSAAQAQSISQNLPGYMDSEAAPAAPSAPAPAVTPPAATPAADLYTVTDVAADVTADNANHARDQALMQAERSAFTQLCAKLNAPDASAKMTDDALASLVQSFEVQSERVSALRYNGVFTIRFKPAAIQRKLGKYMNAGGDNGGAPAGVESGKAPPVGPISHLMVAVQTDSLPAWTQMKRRLIAVPQVAKIDTIDLGRGVSHIDLSYGGSLDQLQDAVTGQGFVLRQDSMGAWGLSDNSMVPR